jgi:hypothetical protein
MNGFTRIPPRFFHLFQLDHKGFQEVIFMDLFPNFAFFEYYTNTIPSRHTYIGLSGFAWPIDDTAHDGNFQRSLHGLDESLNLLCQFKEVNPGTTTGRAGYQLRPPFADFQGTQQLEADPHLLHRITGERNPKSVANALTEKNSEGNA